MLSQLLWSMVCYAVPAGVNPVVVFCASGCESWWAILSQWLWIMLCYADPVIVKHDVLCWSIRWNHGVICWASGCESWWVMMSQWLCIIDVFHWANGCASWRAKLSQWLWIKECYCESPWLMLMYWWWIMVCYSVPVIVNHGVLFCGIGCESWWVMLR
jgi:hypothetical protein